MSRPDPHLIVEGIADAFPWAVSKDPRVLTEEIFHTGDQEIVVLVSIRLMRSLLDEVEREVIESARTIDWPFTWGEIGAAMGITRQSAWQRFGSKS